MMSAKFYPIYPMCLVTWIPPPHKQHIEQYLLAITATVNKSLSSGIFPAAAHHAIVKPLIKKPSLENDRAEELV